jgi:hypothetical protein
MVGQEVYLREDSKPRGETDTDDPPFSGNIAAIDGDWVRIEKKWFHKRDGANFEIVGIRSRVRV